MKLTEDENEAKWRVLGGGKRKEERESSSSCCINNTATMAFAVGISGQANNGFGLHPSLFRPLTSDVSLWSTSANNEGHRRINELNRRTFVNGLIHTTSWMNIQQASARNAEGTDTDKAVPITVTLPLERASGGTFYVRCTLFDNTSDAFKVYRAIVDTGSPYLVLPSTELHDNHQYPEWIGSSLANVFNVFGSTNFNDDSRLLLKSEYEPTNEIYGSVKGQINWNIADYRFRDPRLQISSSFDPMPNRGVVGVLDDALTKEATGGADIEAYALLGLIRNNNLNADRSRFPDPRPTFFEQERIRALSNDELASTGEYDIKSFSMNCPMRELALSTSTLIGSEEDTMSLVDLRKYGDFVDHYAVLVDTVVFDGVTVNSKVLQKASGSSAERPIVAVFDSGLTGCLLTRPFWNVMQTIMARTTASATNDDLQFRFAAVSIRNSSQSKSSASTKTNIRSGVEEDPRLFYIDPIDLDWFDDELTCPYVIVLGQTYLSKGVLTIDMERRLSTFVVNS